MFLEIFQKSQENTCARGKISKNTFFTKHLWATASVVNYLRSIILSVNISTKSSRSGRFCSCQKPNTWPISCTTTLLCKHPNPKEIICRPPRRPTSALQLKNITKKTWKHITGSNLFRLDFLLLEAATGGAL